MATATAVSVLKKIQQAGKRAAKKQKATVHRFPEAASAGDYWRQGDIYLTLLASVPKDAQKTEVVAQLAPGTTQGSRHCVSDTSAVEMYLLGTPTALEGPVLHVCREVTIQHPEHAHVVLPPGVYHVTYQRAFAKELQRVAD